MRQAPLTKTDTLARLQEARQKLISAIEGLDSREVTSQPVVGQWTIRDLMAHILAWEELAIQRLDLIRTGRAGDIEWVPADEVDARNARFHQAYQGLSLEEVRRKSDDVHQRLLAAVEAMTEEQLNVGDVSAKRPWLPFDTYLHEEEHAAHIAQWRIEVETTEA